MAQQNLSVGGQSALGTNVTTGQSTGAVLSGNAQNNNPEAKGQLLGSQFGSGPLNPDVAPPSTPPASPYSSQFQDPIWQASAAGTTWAMPLGGNSYLYSMGGWRGWSGSGGLSYLYNQGNSGGAFD